VLVELEVVVGFVPEIEGASWEESRPGRVTLLLKLKELEASTYTRYTVKVRCKSDL
jgi:hypothetical protein